MSKLTKIALVCCLILCFALTAHAEDDLTVDISGLRIAVSGSTNSSEGANVTVMIVRPGKDITSVVSDADATEKTLFNNTVSFTRQTTVDDGKHFECACPFDEDEKSGIYTARVKVAGESEVREKEFTFVNQKRKTAAEESIVTCTDNKKTEAFLSEYASDIDVAAGGSYDGFTNAERAYVIGKVTDEKDGKITVFGTSVGEINAVRALKGLERAALKEAVDKGEIVGVDNTLLSDYAALSKTKKNQFAAALYDGIRTANTPEDVKKAFSAALTEAKKEEQGGGSPSGNDNGKTSGFSMSGTFADPDRPYIIEPPEEEGFTDLESVPWAVTAIETLKDRGIINGKAKNLFCPQDNVTREEFLKMVVESLNMVGVPEKALTFTDVPADAWYRDYVETGVGCGIIKGFSETEFGTGQPITRQDMATILYRAVKYCEVSLYKVNDSTFTDGDNIDEYAREAVEALSGAKVINGMGDGTFMPKKTSTRAEAAVMLYNLLYK